MPFLLTDYRVNSEGLSANTDKQLETWRRFRVKVRDYAPALDAAHGDIAEGFQLRYLARRAIKGGDGRTALRLMREAMTIAPDILAIEPSRTTVTLAAAVATSVLPRDLIVRAIQRLTFNARAPQAATA